MKLDGVRAKFDAKRQPTAKVEHAAPAAPQIVDLPSPPTLTGTIDVVSRYVCDSLGKVDRKRLVEMRNLVDSLTKRATHPFYTDEIEPLSSVGEPELPKTGKRGGTPPKVSAKGETLVEHLRKLNPKLATNEHRARHLAKLYRDLARVVVGIDGGSVDRLSKGVAADLLGVHPDDLAAINVTVERNETLGTRRYLYRVEVFFDDSEAAEWQAFRDRFVGLGGKVDAEEAEVVTAADVEAVRATARAGATGKRVCSTCSHSSRHGCTASPCPHGFTWTPPGVPTPEPETSGGGRPASCRVCEFDTAIGCAAPGYLAAGCPFGATWERRPARRPARGSTPETAPASRTRAAASAGKRAEVLAALEEDTEPDRGGCANGCDTCPTHGDGCPDYTYSGD